MRLEKLALTGFGRFQGRTVELGPGLNIVYGPNEAGKSTLQKFLLGMLYGFKKKAQRRDYTEDAYRYRPWGGGDYRGALQYWLESTGKSYRVERQFEPNRDEVRIFDPVTGADLSGTFPMDRRKELLFAEEHLRLPEAVFVSTAWVGQMQVGRLETGRELVARVANMQESGREDLSVKGALVLLEEQIKEIGTERAPTRPYARACRAIDEKKQELARAERTRAETMGWEARLTEVRAVLDEIDQELADLTQRSDLARLREGEERLKRIEASTERMRGAGRRADELKGYANFPADLREPLHRAQSTMAGARQQAELYQARLDGLQAKLASVRAERERYHGLDSSTQAEVAALAQEVAALGEQVPDRQFETARLTDSITLLDETIRPLLPAVADGQAVMAQVDELERQLTILRGQLSLQTIDGLQASTAMLERKARAASGWGWLYASGGALLIMVAVLPFSLPLAAVLALLGVGLGLRFALGRRDAGRTASELQRSSTDLAAERSRLSQVQEQIIALERAKDTALTSIGVSAVADVRSRVIRHEQLMARRDGQQASLDSLLAESRRLEARLASGQDRLKRLLNAALGDGADLEHFYMVMKQVRAVVESLETLEREERDISDRLRAELARADGAEAEWRSVLAQAGVADDEGFEAACALREAWQQASSEAQALDGALSALLAGENPEALAAEVERLRATLSDVVVESRASGALQTEVRRLEGRRADLFAQASDLAARIETAVRETADTADLRREIVALLEERQALDDELGALELARSTIAEVGAEMHREFAPKLNHTMGQFVSRFTDGKYRTVKVDEALGIRVITEDDRTVELTSLSGGTVDQIYLSLRLALLDLITEGQEPIPLILDDPFIQYDDERAASGLTFLATLSKERQVILLTCHDRERRVAQTLGIPVHTIDLTLGGAR